ncbi:MAG: hypothetical protein ACNI28_12435 [Arcobacter sp.]|uniref:hypothetical protein n=1 Tax=Arcobacter sp. TaxID=1872629 RepID=UPI003B00E093
MNINLVHFIVPCIDSIVAKNFYKRIFGFKCIKKEDNNITVKINEKMEFMLENTQEYINNHYIFEVDQNFFDTIIINLKKEEMFFGDNINHLENNKIKKTTTKSEVFFIDPNSHLFQIFSKTSTNPQ